MDLFKLYGDGEAKDIVSYKHHFDVIEGSAELAFLDGQFVYFNTETNGNQTTSDIRMPFICSNS